MKKLISALVLILIVLVICVILFNNRAKMATEAQSFKLSNYPVTVEHVTQQNVNSSLTQVGVVAANHDVAVTSETQGRITSVYVKVGSYVTAGSPLVKVDDELTRSRYDEALSNYEKAQKDVERLETLHKQEIISDTQLEAGRLAFKAAAADYTTARRQYTNSDITAPFSGVVSARPVDYGTVVNPGTVIANIVDISQLKVELNLAEEDAFRAKVGDRVEITTDVYPNVKFNGWIDSISAKGDEAHTYPVQVIFKNSNQNPLKAGMFARANFLPNHPTKALVIPRDALVGSVKQPQVYVVEGDKARLRSIVIGQTIDTNLVVLDGLKEGETIVVSGQNNLIDNTTVTIIKS